jgi:hypothetical protein
MRKKVVVLRNYMGGGDVMVLANGRSILKQPFLLQFPRRSRMAGYLNLLNHWLSAGHFCSP